MRVSDVITWGLVCHLVSLQINFLFLLRLHDIVIIYMVESLSCLAGLLTRRLMDTMNLKDTPLRKSEKLYSSMSYILLC